jgi:serine/threonine protein kinase
MTPERWQRIEEVLQAALDRPPAERASYLGEVCADDEELQRETNSLLDAYDEAGDFFSEPAIARDAQVFLDGDAEIAAGSEIGPYQTVRRIGGGGMGEVYLVRDPRLGRLAVLKLIRAPLAADDPVLGRFQNEARAASALNHPNILTVYEIGQFADSSYIATEYVDGPTISERIKADDLTLKDVLSIAGQVLSGLETAHAAGIIHRDIKPANLAQRRDGTVKILDFGIAMFLEPPANERDATARDGEIDEPGPDPPFGTIGYMSPEQIRALSVDERTDIWSCGVLLYEMLAGRRPFDGETLANGIIAMLERQPEPIFGIDVRDSTLRELQEIVRRALSKDRAERYQTAAEMRAALEKVTKGLESHKQINAETKVKDVRRWAAQSSWFKSQGWIWMGAAAALVILLIAAVYFYPRHLAPAAATAPPRPYVQLTEAEKLAFVEAQEQRISAMMGDRPVKLNDEAVRAIKTHVDRYVSRNSSSKPGDESLRQIYARAPEHIPVIARAFVERKIPIVVGIYLPMIESAYRPCYENDIGAKGLFQFLPATAAQYGVSRAEMCDVSKNAPAAAHYIADRMAELGDDSQSMTLVLVSYNRGAEAVREALRRLRETDAHYERNFWTLFANRDKLDEGFQRESAGYVPEFFAAAIIGENPDAFDLQMQPLSSFAQAGAVK